ncbi:MAG TPA: UMP kinase [Bacteroidales bacterium]|nr:UMP kinase [Bacteroidales bacterium]HPS49741.1 UMP kinase [Bacteroidales bacterium]
MKLRRVLLKLSGESLEGSQGYGIDPVRLNDYAAEIVSVVKAGVEVAIVIGGGNIFRGLAGTGKGMDRVQGDYMGMLATVINSLALQAAIETAGLKVKVLSGLSIDPVCESMSRRKAIDYLEQGYLVIIAGGTGNPYFTTDSAAALRAIEIKADVILKGTRVDGIYTADPEKDPAAVRYEKLTFEEAYSKGLKIMDLTAFTLCRENNLPVVVFNMNEKGGLHRLIKGELVGTLVTN